MAPIASSSSSPSCVPMADPSVSVLDNAAANGSPIVAGPVAMEGTADDNNRSSQEVMMDGDSNRSALDMTNGNSQLNDDSRK